MRADGSAAPGVTAFGPVVSAHPDEMPQVFTPSARPAPIDASPQIVIARGFEELTRHRLALDDLAADTLERNVFYESILAEPAVRSEERRVGKEWRAVWWGGHAMKTR